MMEEIKIDSCLSCQSDKYLNMERALHLINQTVWNHYDDAIVDYGSLEDREKRLDAILHDLVKILFKAFEIVGKTNGH